MAGKRVRRRTGSRRAPVLAATSVAAVALVWGLGQLQPDLAPAGALDVADGSGSPSSTSSAPAPAAPAAAAARRIGPTAEAPTQVRLPSGTTVGVKAVSTTPAGVLDVPDDVRTAGWWRGGARLGDPFGSTLIAAHIDSRTQGLGPYVELLRFERGDRIVVRSKHLVQRFAVTSLRLVPRNSLADATDLFAASGPHRLTMVTCAGPFDESRGGYQNLAVVVARPVADPEPWRSPR